MCARSNRNSAAAATSSGFSDSSCPRVVCQQLEQTLVFPRASALVDAACMRDGTQSMPGDIVGLDGRALSTGHAHARVARRQIPPVRWADGHVSAGAH